MSKSELEGDFPQLEHEGYQITSPKNHKYNCIGYALGDDQRWWEPGGEPNHYWPEQLPREYALPNFLNVFRMHGYELCANGDLEPGFEKVAIYGSESSSFTHVALQLPSGMWTSKVGRGEDIIHMTLEGLEDATGRWLYGFAYRFLKRPRPDPSAVGE